MCVQAAAAFELDETLASACNLEVVAVPAEQSEAQVIRGLLPAGQYDLISLTAAAATATGRNALFEAGLALVSTHTSPQPDWQGCL